jgi:PTS hybrid protein
MSPVGIVLVSHSPKLAEGLAELLAQIGSDSVPVAVAAGSLDGGIGTSVDRVVQAIRRVDLGQGVVILPDLGSAVLTVRTVMEGGTNEEHVLVDAPFVEGAVAAAVTAASGAPLDVVVAAAQEARDVRKL